jgi:hypothetical protein
LVFNKIVIIKFNVADGEIKYILKNGIGSREIKNTSTEKDEIEDQLSSELLKLLPMV